MSFRQIQHGENPRNGEGLTQEYRTSEAINDLLAGTTT
jgi:hypothetical protein